MSNSPVRILHVSDTLGLGGTEKVMQLLLTHLGPGFEPTVFSFASGPRARQIRALGIDTYIGGDLFQVLTKLKPHIVHIHRGGWATPKKLRAIIQANVPVIVETNVFGQIDTTPAASSIDHTLFVSNYCLKRYCETNHIKPDPARYSVLYNPVDTDFFAENSTKDRDFSRPVAGRISRPDPGKWSRLALDFLPAVVRDVPGFRYHVIGAIPEAIDFVRDNGLEQAVRFHDPVETDAEIAAFLDTVSVLVHANDTGESFGLVIAEAMACGLPVITHPCPGLKDNAQLELVEDGVTGLVATNAEEYGNALKVLFAHPDKARAMGLAGQRKAARLFRAQTIAAQLETMYMDLLSRKGITI